MLISLLFLFALSCEDDRFNQYVVESQGHLTRLQEEMQSKWGIERYEHFDWDQQGGTIAFSTDGKVEVLADIQFVGSVSKKSGTWLWAWANPSIEEPLRRDVVRVAELGRKEQFSKLVMEKWPADQEDGWSMTAIAARVLDAEGAYRTEGTMIYTYMLLKNIRRAPPGYESAMRGTDLPGSCSGGRKHDQQRRNLMQVSCFAFNWEEVRKRPNADAIVEEMIRTDDIDLYATYLPDEIWPGDSAMLHFAVASGLSGLLSSPEARLFPGVDAIAQLISEGESIDELGLSPLTEGAYFVSLSPERVSGLCRAFDQLPVDAVAERCSGAAGWPAQDIALWLRQWHDALAFAQARGLGVIGHCG